MRHIILLLFVFTSLCVYSQPIVNRSSAANTVSDARLQAGLNFLLPRYSDTTAANTNKGIDSTGAIVYTYTPNGIWIRKANPKRWVRIDVSATPQGILSVLNTGNDADGRSIYNLSTLYTLDTIGTGGVFQLGYGVYTVKFPRVLTANRTLVVPDKDDTLATKSDITTALSTNGLQAVTDAGYVTTNPIFCDYLHAVGQLQVGQIGSGGDILITNGSGGSATISSDLLTGGRTLQLPDEIGIIATRHYADSVAAGIATPTLQQVTTAGNEIEIDDDYAMRGTIGGQEVWGVHQSSSDNEVYFKAVTPSSPDEYALYMSNQFYGKASGHFYALSFGSITGDLFLRAPDFETGIRYIATKEWVGAQGYATDASVILTTTGTSGAATWNSGTRTLNIPNYAPGTTYTGGSGITISSTVVSADTTVLSTRRYCIKVSDSTYARVVANNYLTSIDSTTYSTRAYAKKVGDSTYARVIANNYLTSIDSTTYATRAYAKKVGDSTYARVIAQGFISAIDSTTYATRAYAKKVGDSTYARVIALSYLTTTSAASTYVPQTRTISNGFAVSGGGDLSANRTLAIDTTSGGASSWVNVQKAKDSIFSKVPTLAASNNFTGTLNTFSSRGIFGGTTNSVTPLAVKGNSSSTGLGIWGTGTTYDYSLEAMTGGTDYMKFRSVSAGTVTTHVDNILVLQRTGRVGIGTSTPTAWLHLQAGVATASGAPLKLTSGTNLTTPEAGAIEYNGTDLFVTNSTANRYTIARFITTGTAPTAGTATLSSGSVTISTTAVAAGSVIELSYQNCSNCGTVYKGTITAGTSFVINSTNGTDASSVSWRIIY